MSRRLPVGIRATLRYFAKKSKDIRRKVLRQGTKYNPNQIYSYIQKQNMKLANVNVSTGAVTYYNPTSTVSYFGSSTTNVLNDACFAMSFKLSDLVQATTFTGLYDQYRITKVKVIIGRTANQQGIGNAAQAVSFPSQQLWWVVDVDDASVPANLSVIQEYSKCKCRNMLEDKEVHISFKPHCADALYSGGVFSSYGNRTSPWIDVASPSVEHYGLKLCIPCPIGTVFAEQNFTIRTEYYLDFKNVR